MHGITQSNPSQNWWRTPKGDNLLGRGPHTLNNLIDTFDLVLDPCCSGINDCLIPIKKGGKFFTKEDDGLNQDWKYNTIFNPPFSKTVIDPKTDKPKTRINKDGITETVYKSAIGDWIIKAISQVQQHGITVIGILPVYTSQTWFHQYIHNVVPVDFIHGRVHFTSPEGKTGSPNFDTMLVFWMTKK